MKTFNIFRKYGIAAVLFTSLLVTGCSDDDDGAPPEENEEEVITDVKLIFTNVSDTTDIVEARAQDPDGEGTQELAILDEINLNVNKTYQLTYEIFNNLETPGEDIGAEIEEEDDEHQIFYSFSDDAFASPAGNGNIDNAGDAVNYNDFDVNARPVGLLSTWTTSSDTLVGGNFTIRLQHQPDGIKTATSGATDGDSDFDLTFVLNIR